MGMKILVRNVRPEEWLTIDVGGVRTYIQLRLQRGTARTVAAVLHEDGVRVVHTKERPGGVPFVEASR